MSLPNEPRNLSLWDAFKRFSAADPWVAGGLVGAVAVGLLVAWESGREGTHLGPVALRVLVLGTALSTLGALWACRRHSPYLRERRFWTLAASAQAFFVPALGLRLFAPRTVAGLEDLGLGLFFVLMILAAEARPDRRRSADTSRLDALWVQPAAALFAAALWIYFSGIAYARRSSAADLEHQSLLLFSTLGVYLCGRFGVLALRPDSSRWRLPYALLAAAFAALLAADWTAGPDGRQGTAGLAWTALGAWLPAVATGVLRRWSGGGRKAAAVSLDLSSAHRGTTLLWALALPFLHVLLHRLDQLPEADRPARELVVLVTLGVLGVYALAQRYWTELEAVRLWQKQRRTAEELRSSEQDLRLMVERNRGFRELEQSEKKFSAAFRLSPDGMMITTVREGTVVDANESFCRLFDLDPEAVIGRRTRDLGLWRDDDQRDALILEMLTRGAVRDKLVRTGRAAEEGRRLSASFELIFTGETKLMLTVVREMGDDEHRIEPLSPTTTAVFGTDADHRIVYWSHSAEELFGRTEDQALERSVADLGLPAIPDEARLRQRPAYRGRATDADGRPLRLTCHSSPLAQEDGTSGLLTFAGPSSRAPSARASSKGRAKRR